MNTYTSFLLIGIMLFHASDYTMNKGKKITLLPKPSRQMSSEQKMLISKLDAMDEALNKKDFAEALRHIISFKIILQMDTACARNKHEAQVLWSMYSKRTCTNKDFVQIQNHIPFKEAENIHLEQVKLIQQQLINNTHPAPSFATTLSSEDCKNIRQKFLQKYLGST